jgi:hypothetical protein
MSAPQSAKATSSLERASASESGTPAPALQLRKHDRVLGLPVTHRGQKRQLGGLLHLREGAEPGHRIGVTGLQDLDPLLRSPRCDPDAAAVDLRRL